MAECAASLARELLLPKIKGAVKMLRDPLKEVADITDELENFRDFINAADKVVEAEQDNNRRDRMKERLMRLREASFRMEDAIDEYILSCEEQQPHEDEQRPDDPRCTAFLRVAVDFIKTQIPRFQSAYKIQEAKSVVDAEKDAFQRYFPFEQRPTSSRGNQDVTWQKLRMDPLFIEEDEVVGLDGPRAILKNWLTKGRERRTVISVVGIAGVGKTTIAKQVYDQVHNDFDCHALITVSQSYSAEGLLRHMLNELCKEKKMDPPKDVSTVESLIKEVRNCLHNKRYVVLFDDVWNENFWDDIESAVIDNKNGSRVLITTRDEKVAEFCKKSSLVELLKLTEPLSEEESFKLFCKKAFQYSADGRCPEKLKNISIEIVRKCKGLPLAIVVIGGVLSQKDENAPEWELFSQDLSLELERNSYLNSITKILGLSYDDLSINLRSCLLYVGMYPEDYEIKSGRLIKQWIAEGFVKHETGKTLEEVAQQYLSGLIRRSLVQVSSLKIDGKVKKCRVHDLIHDMILRKAKDTGFCKYIDEHSQLVSSGIIRCLTVAIDSNDVIGRAEKSHIRSILVFIFMEELPKHFINGILGECMPLLKVIDFEDAPFSHVPENFGNLIQLKYLSFRNTHIKCLPKSIDKLQNLETLDIRNTYMSELPKEISKLRKLCYLLSDAISFIALKDTLGSMTSLQKIPGLEIDEDGVVIRELGKLKQLRSLMITHLKGELANALCSSINEMKFLEKLHIEHNEVIDLDFMSTPFSLRKLSLNGKLEKLPSWIPQLQNLVKLSLENSRITDDPLESMKDLPNLLFLSINYRTYVGETLHFHSGGFQKLKELELSELFELNYIIIDRGALHSLKMLRLNRLPRLKTVPSGIQHLKKLEVLTVSSLPYELKRSLYPGGHNNWLIQHVSHVHIERSDVRVALQANIAAVQFMEAIKKSSERQK